MKKNNNKIKKMPRLESLDIKVGQTINLKVKRLVVNPWKKIQPIASLEGENEEYWLNAHQQLVNKIVENGIKDILTIKRLSKGSQTEEADYEVTKASSIQATLEV